MEVAYRPLLLRLLANQFIGASTADQRALLATRQADLLDQLVRDYLAGASEDKETGNVARAAALLDLATRDASGSTLTATFEALEEPARLAELLAATAFDMNRVADMLEPIATIAWASAPDQPVAAVAALYLAIAAAIHGDQDWAAQMAGQALALDPSGVPAWIARLAQLGPVQPSVLPLSTVLIEGQHDGGD